MQPKQRLITHTTMSNPDQEIIVIDDPPNEPKEPVKPNVISDAITSHIQMTQTNKKIPNIAQELAMNRNNSRTLSPSAPTIPLTEAVINNDKKEQVKPKPKPKPKSKTKPITEKKVSPVSNSPVSIDEKSQQLKQVRIASLLSTGEEPKITTSLEKSIDMTKQMPSNLRFKQDSPTPSNISRLLSPPAKTIPIVPITKTTATTQKKPTDTKPVEKKITKPTSVTVVPKKKTTILSNKPALKRTKSNSAATGSTTSSSTASKKNSTTGATKASKSKSATSLDSIKKKATTKKSQDNDKKKNSDNATKTTSTSSTTTNKIPTVPEPSKLIQPPLIGDAKLLSKTNSVSEKDEPISIVDIPLYSSASNEYLDENGTVTFNLFRILKQNEPKLDGNEEKDLKRKRLFNQDLDSKDNMTDVDDIIEDDEDMEDNTETDKTDIQPKKKAHPMKGKNLIGKYDFEDPFIDDSEMLWEEQRASTKDGFFVFFGPLIAKGQSASFERADGTMKRGGIKK